MGLSRFALWVPTGLVLADAAIAGTPVGVPVGVAVGVAVGQVVGTSALPIAGLSLLGVAAAGLAIGIRIVRRKRKD